MSKHLLPVLYASSVIALTGQICIQVPHLMHFFLSISALPPFIVIAFTGHIEAHAPQPKHLLLSTFIILSLYHNYTFIFQLCQIIVIIISNSTSGCASGLTYIVAVPIFNGLSTIIGALKLTTFIISLSVQQVMFWLCSKLVSS